MRFLFWFLFVIIPKKKNAEDVAKCVCPQMGVIIYAATPSQNYRYYSWEKVCNQENKLESKQSSILKYTQNDLESLKLCLKECEKRIQYFESCKFWLGLRYRVMEQKWVWEKDNSTYSDRHQTTNEKNETDKCSYIGKNEKWNVLVDNCTANNYGFICEHHKINDSCKDEPTVTPKTNFSRSALKKMEAKLEIFLDKALKKKNYKIKTAIKLLHQLQEPIQKIVETSPLQRGSLYKVGKLLQSMTKYDFTHPLLARNLTESILNIASHIIKVKNAPSWTNIKENSTTEVNIHPMTIVEITNKVVGKYGKSLKGVKNYQKNYSTIQVRVRNIDNKMGKLLSPVYITQYIDETIARNFTSVAIVYNTLPQLLYNIDQISQQTEGSEKEFIPSSDILSYTLFEQSTGQKVSTPLKFTIPLQKEGNSSNHNNTTLSCQYYIPANNTWSTKGCEVEKYDFQSVLCSCQHTTNFAVLLVHTNVQDLIQVGCFRKTVTRIVEYVTACFSIFFLSTTIAIYLYIKESVKTSAEERVRTNLNLSIAMLGFFISIMFSNTAASSYQSCVASTFFTQFFLVSMFAWLMMEGLLLHLYIIQGNLKNRSLGVGKYIVGWVLPLIIGVTTLVVGLARGEYIYTRRNFGDQEEQICWLSIKNGQLWAVTGPVLITLSINLFILFQVLFTIVKLSKETSKFRPSQRQESDKNFKNHSIKRQFRIPKKLCVAFLKLYPILGFPWTIGWILTFIINEEDILHCKNTEFVVVSVVHTIINGLQGLFVFIVCIVNDKYVSTLFIRKFNSKMKWNINRKTSLSTSYYQGGKREVAKT